MPRRWTPGPDEPPGTGAAHWCFGTTADVGIGARGPTPERLFEQLGLGFADLVSELERVRPQDAREVHASSSTLEGLVVAYLTELIALFDEEAWLPCRLDVHLEGDPPTSLRAEMRGERFDASRHPLRVQVKAVTLHRLLIDLDRGRAEVIVDI